MTSLTIPRIILVGAESTGKTTLALRLAEHFNATYVAENARELAAAIGHTAENPHPWQSDDFLVLAAEQQRREDEAAERANRLLICDTDAFASAIWHERFIGCPHPQLADPILPGRRLYLLTSIEAPFVQDGQRDRPHLRLWMHRRFETELARLQFAYIALPADRDAAFRIAVDYVSAEAIAPSA